MKLYGNSSKTGRKPQGLSQT